MLPVAASLTPELADRWRAHRVPSWAIWVTVGLWVAAFAAAVIGDTEPCSAADPSECGPDQAFAWWFVVCAATPVLLPWMPLLGCLAGVAFAVAELRYDDVAAGRVSFAIGGLACAGLAAWLVASSRRQRAALPAASLVQVGKTPSRRTNQVPRTAATVLILVGIGCFGWYEHAVAEEDRHLARREARTATVVAVDSDDYELTLAVPGDRPRRLAVEVIETDWYPKGSAVPVYLDPDDPSWVRLVAEPLDVTYWESLGAGSWLLALLLVGRQALVRRRAAALVAAPAPGLAVRVVRLGGGERVVVPGEGPARPVARLRVGPDEDEDLEEPDWDAAVEHDFGREWRGETTGTADAPWSTAEPEPAVLVGQLHDRGVATLLTQGDAQVCYGVLRLVGGDGPLVEDEDEDEEGERLPGSPVAADPTVPLPSVATVARPPLHQQLLGAAMLLAALTVVPGFLLVGDDDTLFRVLAVVVGGELVTGGTSRAFQRLSVTRGTCEVVGRGRRYVVPWDRVHGVRRDDDVLVVAWEPGTTVELGPFDRGESPDAAARADLLGRQMMTLRERALAFGPARGEVSERLGPLWLTLPAYGAVVAAALLRLVG